MMNAIEMEAAFRTKREAGKKLLGIYITGGAVAEWGQYLRAVVDAGVDVIEFGIPFSDPVMDGPVIQRASVQALERGANPRDLVRELGELALPVPVCAMTYFNVINSLGFDRAIALFNEASVAGTILPDLPFDEAQPWDFAATSAGLANIGFVSPVTASSRTKSICSNATGFVYAIGLMGVTGVRDSLADSAIGVAEQVRMVSDIPVLIGVGISTPEQAHEAAQHSDGVIVGSAIMQMVLDGASPNAVGDYVRQFRNALDENDA